MEQVKLTTPKRHHAEQATEYLREFYADKSEFHGTGGLERFMDASGSLNYDGWLKYLEAGRNRAPGGELVPAETFFLIKNKKINNLFDGDSRTVDYVVGTIDIRLTLNDALTLYGGNIGYSIRPTERGKGYAKRMLYLALEFCAERGMEAILIDCANDNIPSAKTIRALDGKLLREHEHLNPKTQKVETIQQYTIDVASTLARHKNQF